MAKMTRVGKLAQLAKRGKITIQTRDENKAQTAKKSKLAKKTKMKNWP